MASSKGAGLDQDASDECRGSLHHLQCLQLCCNDIWEATAVQPEVDEDQCLLLNAAPTCPRCGGLARPNVLMFTDFEWLEHRQQMQARRMENWLAGVQAPAVVGIGVVPPYHPCASSASASFTSAAAG